MKPASKGMRLVGCPGEAHSNAFIDNCGLCAPRWGYIEIPAEFTSLQEYDDFLERQANGYVCEAPDCRDEGTERLADGTMLCAKHDEEYPG